MTAGASHYQELIARGQQRPIECHCLVFGRDKQAWKFVIVVVKLEAARQVMRLMRALREPLVSMSRGRESQAKLACSEQRAASSGKEVEPVDNRIL